MLLVCRSHIKNGLIYLDTPHISRIKNLSFQGRCVFCQDFAQYKLFYSVPVTKSHRISVQQNLNQDPIYQSARAK